MSVVSSIILIIIITAIFYGVFKLIGTSNKNDVYNFKRDYKKANYIQSYKGGKPEDESVHIGTTPAQKRASKQLVST